MFQVPATVMGMIGSAFMVASFSPGAVGRAGHDMSTTVSQSVATAKGDRIAAPMFSAERRSVSVVELVGVSNVKVILKDSKGEVVFQSDPQNNTTYFSKDTDLPVITLKEEASSNVRRSPVTRQSGEGATAPKRRTQPHGCLGAVSPLAQAGKEAAASLCVTDLRESFFLNG
jgi:hypothetical protein